MTRSTASLAVPLGQARIHWAHRGQEIANQLSACRWELGDWWNEAPDGIDAPAAAETIGLAVGTLWELGYVARAFHPTRRRTCPHTHHREVAALPAPVADALLDQAVAEHWSVARIRQEARNAAHDQAIEAERQAQAVQRELTLEPTAAAWHVDSRRIDREIREKTVTLEATARAIIDAVEDLASHPGLEHTHGSRRRAVTEKLRYALMPAGTGIDLSPLVQPLLDQIWSQSLPSTAPLDTANN